MHYYHIYYLDQETQDYKRLRRPKSLNYWANHGVDYEQGFRVHNLARAFLLADLLLARKGLSALDIQIMDDWGPEDIGLVAPTGHSYRSLVAGMDAEVRV